MARLPKGWVPLAADPRWKKFAKRYAGDLERFAREVVSMAPSEQQIELFAEIQAPRARVSIASGHGCFAAGTRVKRDDGSPVAVEHVQVGDWLLGADGVTPVQVEQLKRGRQLLYRLDYVDGSSHTVNLHHLLCLTDGRCQISVPIAQWLKWSRRQKARFTAYRLIASASKGAPAEYARVPIMQAVALGEGDYFGFALAGADGRFLGEDDMVLHNTGKTTSIATIVLWHMLCFPGSVTMLTANDMDQLKATLWKEIGLASERIRTGAHGWIYPHIDLLSDGTMRVKGYEKTWFVESKTANAKTANKMAGRHGKYFLIIGDEASTLPDEVCTTLNSALTEDDNRFLLTSQPTKTSGFFYNTHHSLSIYNGGTWVPMVFSSFDSPFVADSALIEMWEAYEEDQRRVRLLGIFPQDSSKHFMNRKEAESMYERGRIIADDEQYGWVVLGDIASGEGQRDKSAIVLARIIGEGDRGDNPRRMEVVVVPIHTNKIRSNVFSHYAMDAGADLVSPTYGMDAGGLGINVCQDIEDAGKVLHKIWWGKPCFRKENKMRYINRRAQATHHAARAAKEGRLSILTHDHKRAMLDQASRIPKAWSDKGLMKVPPKGSPEWEGLSSPDLWDTICFGFLEDLEYIPWTSEASSASTHGQLASMEAEAAALFGDA